MKKPKFAIVRTVHHDAGYKKTRSRVPRRTRARSRGCVLNDVAKHLLILIWLSGLLAGCSFNVAEVPSPEEFSGSIREMVDRYPDMSRVFKSYAEDSEPGMARIEPFVEKWGEPESKATSWWNLWPGNWLFIPQELWIWELSGRDIQCRVDHPIYEGFRKTICNCEELNGERPVATTSNDD